MKSSTNLSGKLFGHLFVALLGLLSIGAAHAQIVISDSTFNNADWSFVSDAVGGNPAGTGSFSQIGAGGDPGAYQQVSLVQSTSNGSSYNILTAVIYNAQSYNPATQGSLLSLTFSGDFQRNSTASGYTNFFAEQNGVLYSGPILTFSLSLPATWTNYSDTVSSGSSAFVPSGLNFSSSGAPIYFGVGIFESSPNSLGPIHAGYDLDNFSVTINTTETPEPSTWALLLGGLGLLAFCRTRRAQT